MYIGNYADRLTQLVQDARQAYSTAIMAKNKQMIEEDFQRESLFDHCNKRI
jgi:hypothetical protein